MCRIEKAAVSLPYHANHAFACCFSERSYDHLQALSNRPPPVLQFRWIQSCLNWLSCCKQTLCCYSCQSARTHNSCHLSLAGKGRAVRAMKVSLALATLGQSGGAKNLPVLTRHVIGTSQERGTAASRIHILKMAPGCLLLLLRYGTLREVNLFDAELSSLLFSSSSLPPSVAYRYVEL